jgi:hypothetical protein
MDKSLYERAHIVFTCVVPAKCCSLLLKALSSELVKVYLSDCSTTTNRQRDRHRQTQTKIQPHTERPFSHTEESKGGHSRVCLCPLAYLQRVWLSPWCASDELHHEGLEGGLLWHAHKPVLDLTVAHTKHRGETLHLWPHPNKGQKRRMTDARVSVKCAGTVCGLHNQVI